MKDRIARAMTTTPWEIQTTRLELSPLRREHAALLFDVLADPALYEYTGGAPVQAVDEMVRWFTRWEARVSPDGSELWLNWTVSERAGGAAVGYVQATVSDRPGVNLAWVIGTPWQRRGYASEASRAVMDWLAHLGARRFRACVKPAHVASQRVAARLGLQRTEEWVDGEEVWLLDRQL